MERFPRREMKKERTICNNYTIIAFDGLVGDRFSQINRKQHRIHLSADRIERSFEKHCRKGTSDLVRTARTE